jgi:tetratricopeptide (TPR) repeat protein
MKIIEKLKLELNKNETIYDFEKLDILNNDELKYILENVKPNTGYIKWNLKQSKNNELIGLIENKLICNNENYKSFASDFIHCYLCYHCTQYDQIDFDDQQWKIEEVYHFDNYTSILYVNDLNKQMILAFKGIQLTIPDNAINSIYTLIDIYSQIANQQIEPQLFYSYSHLKSTIKLIKKNKVGYSLSFTGAYYGALLADLSVFLSMNIFNFNNVKSVTFESIGTFNYLNDLKAHFKLLNLVTYLTEPNYLNICNKHFTGNHQLFKIISNDNNNNNNTDLKVILNKFNPLTGKPYQFKQIKEWPQLQIENVSIDFNNKLLNAIDNLMLIKKINSNKLNYNLMAINLLKNLIITINFIIDSTIIIDFKSENEIVFNCNDFKVCLIKRDCLLANYDLNSEQLNNLKETSIHKLLYNLYHYPNRLEFIRNLIIKQQLIRLRRLYDIEQNEIKSIVTTIEQIKYRLERLLLIDKKSVLDNLVINKSLLKSDKIEIYDLHVQMRYNELIEIKNLFKNKQYVYIKGKSGSGKTILSKQYANLTIDDKIIIKWIQADQLLNYFIQIIKEFNINLNFNQNNKNYWFKLFEKMKQNLNLFTNSNDLKLLFIIDNLTNNDTNDFKYLTYGLNLNVKFLITTQLNIQTTANGIIYLNEFNKNQAVEYLSQKITNKDDCYDLVNNLLENETNLLPIHLNKLLVRRTMTTTDNKQENKKSFEILNYLAYLNNDYISFDLIKKLLINNDEIKSKRKQKIKEIELKQNLNYLIESAELSRNSQTSYSINKQTQIEVLKYYLSKENKEITIINNILKVLNDYSNNEHELFSHAIKILQFKWKDQCLNIDYIQLKLKLALIYKNTFKKHLIALDYLRQAYKHQNDSLIQNQNEISLTLVHIGDLYMELNELKKSIKYYEKALALQLKSLPTIKNTQIAETYFKIGLVLDSQSDYKKALEYYELALRIYKKLEINDKLIHVYNNIGLIYSNHNEYTIALEYLNNSNNNDGIYLNNLGGLYYNQGDYLKSLEYFEQLLNIQQDVLASNDLNLALTYNNIAGIYDDLGDYSKAFYYYQKSLLIEKDSLNHLNIACLYINIGGCYLNQGDYEKALDYFENAYRLRKEILPNNHLDLALCLKNISGVYQKTNDLKTALIYLEEAIRIENKVTHFKHYDLACSFQNLACIHFHQNEYDKAMDLNDKSFQIRKNLINFKQNDLAVLYNNYGLIYRNEMKYDKALESYNKALKKWSDSLPLNHPIIALTYNNIGCTLVKKNEFKKALLYLEKSLSISKESLQFDHPNIVLIYSNITYVYDQIYLNKYSNK